MARYVVAITGASGVIYGFELVRLLLLMRYEVHLIVSEPARLVIEQELGFAPDEQKIRDYLPPGELFVYDNSDIAAVIASGSFITEGMIIIPCSMSTLAAVAHGMSDNLIERAADVALKERRTLVVVPRETPLSTVHLRNMLSLAEMGVALVPAMPAFYHQPRSIADLVAFVVGKVLDVMKIPNDCFNRYGNFIDADNADRL